MEPYYNNGDFPFLRVADVDTNIDYDGCIRVPQHIIEDARFNTLKVIDKGDILITKGGSIARVGLIEKKTAVTRDLIFINSSSMSEIGYKFLFLYLLSNVSYSLLIRSSSMTAQPHLTIKLVRDLPLFAASENFKNSAVKIYNHSIEKLERSRVLYSQAERMLLEEVGLLDFEPTQESVNIKSFKESFCTSGRLDAEYYQTKYEQVVEKVMGQPFDKLSHLVNIKKSIEPGSINYDEEGLPFMRVADFSKNGLTAPQKHLSLHFVQENSILINKLKPRKGTILFSKDGSVGMAYHLREDVNGITSGAILHLNVKDTSLVIPEYLTLVLNSDIVQKQAERDAGGSIILHWRVSEIENIVVPIIDYDKQQQIAEWIEKSFSLKKQSEHLLDVAKRAVEIAIEESEAVALDYINTEVSEHAK